MKNFFLGLVSVVIALFVLLLCLEAGTRVWYLLNAHVSNQKMFTILSLDKEFGWLPAPNYLFAGELRDAGGERYLADISTDAAGFRQFGHLDETERRKVLFIGDSFTHAMQVSDDKTFFSLLGNELDLDVFAYGVGAYGTLQEYLVLDRYVDEIQPDAVILQLCPNDLINNHPDLERRSSLNQMGLRRPYLIDGKIEYDTAAPFGWIRNFAAGYSHFLYAIIKIIDRLNVDPESSIERVIRVQGVENALYRESLETTGEILKMIKQRVPPGTEVYAFSSDWGRPFLPDFRRITEEAGISFINGTGRALSIVEKSGATTRAADTAHWNNTGHRIVANVLRQYLEDAWSEQRGIDETIRHDAGKLIH